MMTYLGIIEQKINELLQTYAVMQQERIRRERGMLDKDDPYMKSLENMLAIGPNQPPTYSGARIEIPTSLEDQSDDDELS